MKVADTIPYDQNRALRLAHHVNTRNKRLMSGFGGNKQYHINLLQPQPSIQHRHQTSSNINLRHDGMINAFVTAYAKGQELELPPVHLWEEAHLTLRCTMVQRVRTAAGVLPGNLPKIQSQDLSSFLYASKRCSSTGSHGIFILVLEPCFFYSNTRHRRC